MLNRDSRPGGRLARAAVLIAACCASSHLAAQNEEPDALVRRLDPVDQTMVPIDLADVIPGKIYNRYSQRHQRYVWSIALEDGKFSYAFGPGTTEQPTNFDLASSPELTQELVEEAAGDWAAKSAREGRQIYVRLGEDGQWNVLQLASMRSHFDLDSGRRWEWHGKRRVPVGHLGGYTWRFDGQWYVPANGWARPWLGGSLPASCPCRSAAIDSAKTTN